VAAENLDFMNGVEDVDRKNVFRGIRGAVDNAGQTT